jgi:hypothetical protein
MLSCAFSVGIAQQNAQETKTGGGSTPPGKTAPRPTGTSKAGDNTDNKPAQRDWKLANQPAMLLPDADQGKLTDGKAPFLPYAKAEALVADLAGLKLKVAATLKDSMGSTDRKDCTDPSIPWIIQAAVFDPENPAALTPARVETYLYSSKSKPAKQEDLQKTRIYASQKACFVLLVRGDVAVDTAQNPISNPERLEGSDAANFTPLPPFRAPGKEQTGHEVFVRKLHANAGQFYAAKKKTPAPLQDLEDLLKFAGLFQATRAGGPVATKPMWIFGMNQIDNLPVPSDMWVQTGKPGSEVNPTAFTPFAPEVQFDNEGYYWYDFSVTFPLNKVDALEYNENDSNVQTKQVDLKTVYATANLFFQKADIKNPSTLWMPRLLFGIGIRGKPYDRMFVGAGFGLNKIIKWAPLAAAQPFAGLGFNRVYVKDGTGAAAVLKGREIRKLVVGINVPVKSVVDRLKAK